MNATKIFKNPSIVITSTFGNRIDPITGIKAFHLGVDYGTRGQKLPQYGLEKGVVLSCGQDGTGGIYANVHYPTLGDHVGVYYHLDRLAVKTGQSVDTNTVIGYTGTTGRSTGIHLHFGWCKKSEIGKVWNSRSWENFEKYSFPIVAPVKKPMPSNVVGYKVGDKVKVRGNARTYTGGIPSSFVYNGIYAIDEIKGDRAVLDKKGICSPFNVKDLILVGTSTPTAKPKPTQPTNNYINYTVKRGDSWWRIASQPPMNNGSKCIQLAKYNGMTIFNAIHAGQVLKIPK